MCHYRDCYRIHQNVAAVCVITGGNTDGTCVFSGYYILDYTYTCNPTTNTYTVTIPGTYLTESLHETTWKCQHPFGGTPSNTKILYVNGELFFYFFPFVLLLQLLQIL
jgi:hypothetical protein